MPGSFLDLRCSTVVGHGGPAPYQTPENVEICLVRIVFKNSTLGAEISTFSEV